jgi:thiol-disulfide isomerase/thioredoxin
MTRTPLLLAAIATGAIALAASPSVVLNGFVERLQSAKTLDVTYNYVNVGGSTVQYRVELKKPNLARVTTPERDYVADGKAIYTYDKVDKTWWKKPQTEADLKGLLADEPLRFWQGFFDAKALEGTPARDLSPVTRGGKTLQAAESAVGPKTTRYYVGDKGVVEQATIDIAPEQAKKETFILNVKNLAVDGDLPAERTSWNAPNGSKEITLDEADSAKWFTSLDEAKKAAAASNRRIFVDFMATWCGPCKMLERDVFGQKRFQALSKKAVFLRIDVDRQQNIAKAYNIEAMPTQMVLGSDGSIQSSTVGYGGPAAFYSWIEGALGR